MFLKEIRDRDMDFILYNIGKQITYRKNRTTIWVNKIKNKGVVKVTDDEKIVITFSKKDKQEGNLKDIFDEDGFLKEELNFPFYYYKREKTNNGKKSFEVEIIMLAKELETIRQAIINDLINIKSGNQIVNIVALYNYDLIPLKIAYSPYDGIVEYQRANYLIYEDRLEGKIPFIYFDIYEIYRENEETLYTFNSESARVYYHHYSSTEGENKVKLIKDGKEIEIIKECIDLKTKKRWLYNGEEIKDKDIIMINIFNEKL